MVQVYKHGSELRMVQRELVTMLRSRWNGYLLMSTFEQTTLIKSTGAQKEYIHIHVGNRSLEHDIGETFKLFAHAASKLRVRTHVAIQGHSWVYYLHIPTIDPHSRKERIMSIKDLGHLMHTNGLKPHLLLFDSCALASLEAASELRDRAHYMIAHESHSNERGFFDEESFSIFKRNSSDIATFRAIVRHYITHIEPSSGLGATVINLSKVDDLMKLLVKIGFQRTHIVHHTKPWEKGAVSRRWSVYDLYLVVMNDSAYTSAQKQEFKKAYNRVVIVHKTSKCKQGVLCENKNKGLGGLAFLRHPDKRHGHDLRRMRIEV